MSWVWRHSPHVCQAITPGPLFLEAPGTADKENQDGPVAYAFWWLRCRGRRLLEALRRVGRKGRVSHPCAMSVSVHFEGVLVRP